MRDQLTQNFYRDEFEENGYDVKIHPRIPVICQMIRNEIGSPLHVTSGVRSPQSNDRVNGSPNSSHLKGLAADISTNDMGVPISPRYRFLILRTLIDAGVNRIGIGSTFIHFDIDEEKPQHVIWTYKN